MTTPYIPTPEVCEECERLDRRVEEIMRNPDIPFFPAWMAQQDHRRVCRVWQEQK